MEVLQLPATGFVRKKTVLKFIPVSSSTWDRWVSEGKAPKPVKLSERTRGYKAEEVLSLINKLREAGNDE